MQRTFYISVIVLCIIVPLSSFGQCPEYEQFKQAYEGGNLEDALILMRKVESCMRNKNKKLSAQDLTAFYKYKTFLYQDLDKSSKAEENIQLFMRKMLRKNPEYTPRQNLPEKRKPDFYELYNRHRYWPTHYLGIRGGTNFSFVNTSSVFSVDQSNGQNRSSYSSINNFSAAFLLELPLFPRNTRLYFTPELAFSRNAYRFEDLLLDFASLKFEESQDWIQLPLLFKYYFQRNNRKNQTIRNKFQPFIEAGVSIDLMMRTEASVSRQDILPDGFSRQNINESFSLSSQRNSLNYSLIAGGGIRFKNFFQTGWDMFLEGRFTYGFPNLVDTENRGANQELLYNFGYIDSDFSLNTLTVSLGFLLPHYNPKPIGISGKPVSIDFSNPSPPKKKKK